VVQLHTLRSKRFPFLLRNVPCVPNILVFPVYFCHWSAWSDFFNWFFDYLNMLFQLLRL